MRANFMLSEDVSGKFTTGTDKQEGGVSRCVSECVCVTQEHDEVTA